MCKFQATCFSCGDPWVRGSSYTLCKDRLKGCQKELKLVEWKTWCPKTRKAYEKALRMKLKTVVLPPCADEKLTQQQIDDLCRECDSEVLDKKGSPKRCESRDCRIGEPEKGTLDPQVEWEAIILKFWPPRYRTRYERARDLKDPKKIEEVSQWASSFEDTYLPM
ncbi:glycoside hydrolase family 92 protein [Apiospora arundinis]